MRRGDLVKMDFGALVGGYHSDMTRTVVLGRAAGWQRDLHALVAAAQQAGRAALRPGASVVEVDAAARDVVVAAGYADEFVHGLGHGVGLQIHEAPLLGPTGSGARRRRHGRDRRARGLPGRARRRAHRGHGGGRATAAPEPLTRSNRELIEVT